MEVGSHNVSEGTVDDGNHFDAVKYREEASQRMTLRLQKVRHEEESTPSPFATYMQNVNQGRVRS